MPEAVSEIFHLAYTARTPISRVSVTYADMKDFFRLFMEAERPPSITVNLGLLKSNTSLNLLFVKTNKAIQRVYPI